MLSYATESSNSSFYLYKDTGVTKLITLDRNPDFALVGTPGVIVSDASGTLSKNADLTALGVLATYSTYTVTTTESSNHNENNKHNPPRKNDRRVQRARLRGKHVGRQHL